MTCMAKNKLIRKFIRTLVNHETGISIIITKVSDGYALTVLDLDKPNTIKWASVCYYKEEALEKAWRYLND